jgi:glutamyl-tRNA reductase
MIDLAVPRNIDPLVNEISGVFRFDIDDLAQFAGRGKAARRDAAAQAEEIVEQATERHWKQLMGDQVNHEMGRIVRSAEAVRQAEMSRISDLLDGLPEDQVQSVDAMTRAIVKKILHQPLKQVRSWAEDGDAERAKVLFSAFKSNDDDA